MGFLKDIQVDLNAEAMTLYKECHDSLLVEAVGLCKDAHAAEDLVMRTFEEFCKNRDKYDPEKGSWLQWLKGIMRNIHHNASRGKSVSCMVYMSPEELALVQDSSENETGAIDAVLANSDAEIVRQAINGLSKEMREVILLKYFEDLPIAQIAKILKTSEDSIKCRLYYARKILAKRLGEKLGKKPVAIVVALLLSVATAFGAWKAAEALGWLPTNEEPQVTEAPTVDNAPETALVPVQTPATLQATDKTISATTSQMTASDNAAVTPTDSKENERTAEMNLKTVKTMAVAATAAALATTAQAATYIWTGATGDGKWSTPGNWTVDGVTESTTTPGKSDSVVFTGALGTKGHSTVDANFQGEYVANLTLAKDFTGSVTLGRDFWVFRVYDQSAGTFNGGSYRFTVGTPSRQNVAPTGSASFYHRGGTFNAPDAAGEFRFDFSYEATDFVSTGGVFNANGGTVTILSSFTTSANAHNWLVYDRTFYNLNFADGSFAPTYRGKGTNTIENAFTFRNGVFNQSNDKYVVFNVLKDCYIGGHTAGGPAVINICGDGEQHVYGDASDCKSISLDVRKTSGKVWFHGEKLCFGRGGSDFNGVRFLSGEIDLSDVDQMAIESYNTNPPLRVDEAAHVVWPTTLKISNDSGRSLFGCVGQEFNNLELTHIVNECDIPYATTNIVNGTLTLNGCSLVNSKLNWSWLPLPNEASIAAALILKGDLIWRRNGTANTGGNVAMIFEGDKHQYIYTDAEDVHISRLIVRKTPDSVLTAIGTNGVLKVGCTRAASCATGDMFVLECGIFEFPTNCLAMDSCYQAHFRQLGGKMDTGKSEFLIENCQKSQLDDFIDPFYDLAIKHGAGTYISLGGSVNVTNDLKILGGHVRGDGTFSVYGDWMQEGVLESVYWSANVRLVGDHDQKFRTTDATQNTHGKIMVEKSSGVFALESDLWHRYNNNCTFALTSGTIKPNGHRFLLQKMSVAAGAGVAFRPALDEIEPMIEATGELTLPASGAVQLDVLGKIEPECVTHVPLFGYGSVSNYSKDRWNVRSWASCAKAPRKSVPLVENVTSEKRLYFNWRHAYGMRIIVR